MSFQKGAEGKTWLELQQRTCEKAGAAFVPPEAGMRVAVARDIREGVMPVNGLRHAVKPGGVGWFIWPGEGPLCQDDDYFVTVCVEHLDTWCPLALPFLGLPPGWRFLTDGPYVDMWFDQKIYDLPID
ncbi:hypothetical protein ACN47A_18885 [Myxococcus fulvus]|uniref:immunity protein Imm33 domain-containing protein n=1 Tax=Myxococcus fulvus TaxID=33 RepID=UPI003B9A6CBF